MLAEHAAAAAGGVPCCGARRRVAGCCCCPAGLLGFDGFDAANGKTKQGLLVVPPPNGAASQGLQTGSRQVRVVHQTLAATTRPCAPLPPRLPPLCIVGLLEEARPAGGALEAGPAGCCAAAAGSGSGTAALGSRVVCRRWCSCCGAVARGGWRCGGRLGPRWQAAAFGCLQLGRGGRARQARHTFGPGRPAAGRRRRACHPPAGPPLADAPACRRAAIAVAAPKQPAQPAVRCPGLQACWVLHTARARFVATKPGRLERTLERRQWRRRRRWRRRRPGHKAAAPLAPSGACPSNCRGVGRPEDALKDRGRRRTAPCA